MVGVGGSEGPGEGGAGAGAGVGAEVRHGANCYPNQDTSFLVFYFVLILDLTGKVQK